MKNKLKIKKRTSWNKGLKGVQKAWNKGLIFFEPKICPICQQSFYDRKHKNQKYCSRYCFSQSQIGKKISNKQLKAFIKMIRNKKITPEYRRKLSQSHKPENCPFWKDGRYPLVMLLRDTIQYTEWRDRVFKRDNYTCQKCGKSQVYLNAHHKIALSKLFDKFLKKYPKLSPRKDKYKLLKLAFKFRPFWFIRNGITYCIKCHHIIDTNNRTRNKKGQFK